MAFNGVVTADTLVAPSYGLFSVAEVDEKGSGDEHWIDGYYVESDACGLQTKGLPHCADTANLQTSIFDNSSSSPYFRVTGFGILQTYSCENSIGYNAVDRRAKVTRQLEMVSEFAVERELWTGALAQATEAITPDAAATPPTRWLAAATDITPTPGTAVKPATAIALLEQKFAENNPGIQATIHMTPLIADAVPQYSVKDRKGSLLTTSGSNVAVSRGGVGASGPHSGGSTTKHWIYITGPVHVDLGGEELITTSASEIVDAKTNKVTFVAERPAAVYFDGCAWYGVLADATL